MDLAVRNDRPYHMNENIMSQDNFFIRHKGIVILAFAITAITIIGISYFESKRRFNERMTNLTLCNFNTCRPGDNIFLTPKENDELHFTEDDRFPMLTACGQCLCPPKEIVLRMQFPKWDSARSFDFLKEMNRVCTQGLDFIPSETVIKFCQELQPLLNNEENKGLYIKFLETLRLI